MLQTQAAEWKKQMADRQKKEQQTALKINASDDRYRRHNAYDASADKESAKLLVREAKKVVADAQKAKKREAASAAEIAGEEMTASVQPTDVPPTKGGGGRTAEQQKSSTKAKDVNKVRHTVSTDKATTKQAAKTRVKTNKRKQTAMELKAVTKSGVLKATDTFGCRHLGVMQLFCMSVAWYKHYLNEGEFLHGEKCAGDTCRNMPAEKILEQQGKSKSDGSVLYYCDEGCKAMHSNDQDVLRDLKCNYFLCLPCYLDRMEKLDLERKQESNGGVRKSSRKR